MYLLIRKNDNLTLSLKELSCKILSKNVLNDVPIIAQYLGNDKESVSLGCLVDEGYRYLCVNQTGSLEVNRKGVGPWETFCIYKEGMNMKILDHKKNTLLTGEFEFVEVSSSQKKRIVLDLIKIIVDDSIDKNLIILSKTSTVNPDNSLNIESRVNIETSLMSQECMVDLELKHDLDKLDINVSVSSGFICSNQVEKGRFFWFIKEMLSLLLSSLSIKLALKESFSKKFKYSYGDGSSSLDCISMDLDTPDYSRLVPDLYSIEKRNRSLMPSKTFFGELSPPIASTAIFIKSDILIF